MDELLIQIRDLDRAITAHQESIRYEIIKSREHRERSHLLERYLAKAEEVA